MSERKYTSYDSLSLEMVDGVPIDAKLSGAAYARSLRDMQLGPDDVLVTSYPKSGNIIFDNNYMISTQITTKYYYDSTIHDT